MPDIQFDTFYKYDQLTTILHAFAAEYPQLVQVESIGRSYEGRDIWLVTVTNTETGPAAEKPALWVDGNIHASELTPSTACLFHIHTLVSGYGTEADITRCLDTRAFYICPRVNPDGAEWAMAAKPKIIRSSTRPYPFDEEPIDGLQEEDLDGDGRMLMMRLPDPNGAWKVYEQEPRLLVRRDPTETGGQYYRLLPEGTLKNYDGMTIQPQPVKEQLDLNRNFPSGWRQEGEQRGAGPYPTSEPEVHTIVDFIARHPNITGGVTFHTMSGVLLRPYSHRDDNTMPAEDLWTFQKIGAKGTEICGYPNVSVYHEFRYHPQEVITGAFDDWLFDHLGIFAWTVELWSPMQQAGIKDYKFIDWYREHPLEDDLKLLKWSDEQLDGQGHVDWYEFDHPQLGKVELGGWNSLHTFRNPPKQFVAKEIEPFPQWLIWHLLISPRLSLHTAAVKALGQGVYLVRLAIQNEGWLPTYITKNALTRKVVRGIIGEIELPDGATLQSGKVRRELGQLEGRAYKPSAPSRYARDFTDDRALIEWIVHAPQGGTVKVVARHDRAGVVRAELALTE